jgi:hypothetical protein
MTNAEGTNGSREGAVRIWERVDTCLVKTNVGVKATRQLDHRRRKIAADRHGSTIAGCTGKASGAGRSVEQALFRDWLNGIEQGSNRIIGYSRKEVVVAPCDPIMRIPLEFTECIYVDLWRHR